MAKQLAWRLTLRLSSRSSSQLHYSPHPRWRISGFCLLLSSCTWASALLSGAGSLIVWGQDPLALAVVGRNQRLKRQTERHGRPCDALTPAQLTVSTSGRVWALTSSSGNKNGMEAWPTSAGTTFTWVAEAHDRTPANFHRDSLFPKHLYSVPRTLYLSIGAQRSWVGLQR